MWEDINCNLTVDEDARAKPAVAYLCVQEFQFAFALIICRYDDGNQIHLAHIYRCQKCLLSACAEISSMW